MHKLQKTWNVCFFEKCYNFVSGNHCLPTFYTFRSNTLKSVRKVYSLGSLSSQTIEILSRGKVSVKYTGGDAGLCTNAELKASAEITLICAKPVVSKPILNRLAFEC